MGRVTNYVKKRLDEQFTGHPSRQEQHDIKTLKSIAIELAKQIDHLREKQS